MTAITSPQNHADTVFDYFKFPCSKQQETFLPVNGEIGAASEEVAGAGEVSRLIDNIQTHDFQSRLAQFRQSVSAATGAGAQISATAVNVGLSDVNIALKSGENIHFDSLGGNVRFSDTDDGGIEVVTDEFVRIYDQHGQLVSERSDGSPLEGSDNGDVIFNVNGSNVSGNGGNDTIFTMPGNINIDAGDGDDRVYVFDGMGNGGTFNIALGAGNDTFKFIGKSNHGADHALYLDGGDGNDNINLNRIIIGGRIDGGNGNDSITSSELLHNLVILGGSGDDLISLKGLTNGSVDAGAGINQISIEALFSSKIIRDRISAINITNEFQGDLHVFTKDSNGKWVPADGTIDGRAQLSIKV